MTCIDPRLITGTWMGIINSRLPATWWTRKWANVLQHVYVLSFALYYFSGYCHFSTAKGKISANDNDSRHTNSHGISHRKQSHSSIGIKTWLWSCCSGHGCKTKVFSGGKFFGMMHDPVPILVSSTQWSHVARLQTPFALYNPFGMCTFSADPLVCEYPCSRYTYDGEGWLERDESNFIIAATDLLYPILQQAILLLLERARFGIGVVMTAYQMSTCPQSGGLLLTSTINATMVYIAATFYNSDERVATTRDIRRKRSRRSLMDDSANQSRNNNSNNNNSNSNSRRKRKRCGTKRSLR